MARLRGTLFSAIFLAELDENGFDEIYIITVSAGSGRFRKLWNRIWICFKQRQKPVEDQLPEIQKEDENFKG